MSNKALKTTDHFLSLLLPLSLLFFFFVWIESNKDPFLFDVIKLLRLDLGVRVNFFPSIAGSYQKTSDVRHSFKLHGTSFFFSPSLPHKRWRGWEEEGKEGVWKKQTDSPDVVKENPPFFFLLLAAQHLHHHHPPWSNSPPYLGARIPQAPFCAAIKIAHL